ncbi:MAG: YraN family protein [Candidatus Parcubacteria bacterium]|nr:YraN family protein [Candidatus Parcubacteria bacterium]
MLERQALGQSGEQLAVDFLEKKGYQILARNWRARHWGEVDIVARDYSWRTKIFNRFWPIFLFNKRLAPLVFVEVKTKSSHDFGLPEEELTSAKQQKLRRAIQQYFWSQKIETKNWRLDLVAIDWLPNGASPEIRHYEGLH